MRRARSAPPIASQHVSERTFEVAGYGGAPVPCVLYETGGDGVALLLPGGSRAGHRLGGTPARPDLHFTSRLLRERGPSVLEVWWDAEGAPDADFRAWLETNALAGAAAAREGGRSLALAAGRSIGTGGLAALAARGELRGTPTVWLAPLLGHEEIVDALGRLDAPAFVACGEADELCPSEQLARVRGAGHDVHVVPGGNHGLAVAGAAASARALADLLDRLEAFLRQALGSS
jgi:pimeloyl-ACP methyl ester carboxylesterase